MSIETVINALKNIVIHQAQRNETVVRTLKQFNFDPSQPPKDIVDFSIY